MMPGSGVRVMRQGTEGALKSAINATLAALLLVGVATASYAMKTKTLIVDGRAEPEYATLIPEKFGDWKLVPQIRLVTPVDDDSLANRIYSQMIGRAYVDGSGNMVMLLMAYGPRQIDRLQLHRPEICYVAEGFRVSGLRPVELDVEPGRPPLSVSKLIARRENRTERITYWMRVGDDVVSTLFRRQLTSLRYGLKGLIPDGVLIRVSTINMEETASDDAHARFLKDMLAAVRHADLRHFVGGQASAIRGAGAAAPAAGRM
jgi:EpsI family protein